MIDQTSIVHDTLSFLSTFTVTSTNTTTFDHYDEHNVLDFDWLLIHPEIGGIPSSAELLGALGDFQWAGVRVNSPAVSI